MKKLLLLIPIVSLLVLGGCAWEAVSQVPPSSDVFMTTGDLKDGNYKPISMVRAMKINLAFSCIGVLPPLYPMFGPQIQNVLYEQLAKEAKKAGANAVINIRTSIMPMGLIPGIIWIPVVEMSGMAVKM